MARKKSAVEEEVELNMTPMIDVTFQLLIFFIVTMKFRLLEKKLNSYLPTDFGTNTTPQIVDEMFITVKLAQPPDTVSNAPIRERPTRFYIETERIEGTEKEIYGKIHSKIKKFIGDQHEAKGKIEAGVGVPHHKVVTVLDMFHNAGYQTITFVGLAKNTDISSGVKWWNRIRKKLGDVGTQ